MSTHRNICTALAAGLALAIAALPVAAKPTARPKVKPATAHVTTAKPKVKTTTVRPTTVKPSTAHAPKAVKVKTHGPAATGTRTQVTTAKPAQATGKGQAKVKGPAPETVASRSTPVDTPGTRSRPNDTPVSIAPLNPSKAQSLLLKNDNLRAKMATRLPAGIDPVTAAAGFKNLGQFVAAVNASHNQGIDFVALRALMVAPNSMSLGQAVQQLRAGDVPVQLTPSNAIPSDVGASTTTTASTKHKGRS